MALVLDFSIIAVLFIGIWLFRDPVGAKRGNLIAALALSLAFILVLYRHGVIDIGTVVVSLLVGGVAGFYLARVINMIQVPAMVAFQNGAGGVAAFLVSFVELTRTAQTLSLESQISGVFGLAIGALTFSGSMIASAKLANKMRQSPQVLPHHNYCVFVNGAALIVVGSLSLMVPSHIAPYLFILEILLGTCFGILISMRIGGADMPVLISSLNATTGLAASLCGMVIENQLLIAFGATVAASGSILTYFMCQAMNRNIVKVIFPDYQPKRAPANLSSRGDTETFTGVDDQAWAVTAIREAHKVIIVPGYGMALAKAQEEVAALATELLTIGKDVHYAIHPVAGRMPGHMNVLLAEVGVDYDMLVEMDHINPEFHVTDLVIIVGACDVVNPAAVEHEGTPISGMPILRAYEAQKIICCNLDSNPGYSGVDNSLYGQNNAVLLAGDAKLTVRSLLNSLSSAEPAPVTSPAVDAAVTPNAIEVLTAARSIVVIPGYGMALAKAQFQLVELATLLVQGGAQVRYAIHPVAGRMPGHMNVLLAEANVDYDDLLEMDDVNPLFATTDVALVVGACDVVNPAAIESEGTPISGMPILRAQEAKNIIVCNLDDNPGYSGVANPLYDNNKTILLLGDAKETITNLLMALQKQS
ncbi:NAD(P) transhydrogenase subunit beta [Desulfuromusa kysingii]|uniref:proton-translocating NAD(P)(+) transhydrogenase n=1 Tax=Desulfuromusa kysingii TaxID=37625 RepID=A0A1H4C8I4_9BACT|nr:NAD(P)(+) transhydrogenase (Re/Si-specific) subunit beta [Desulfuromusa kysingii]SEA56656.1 NAD(P) transhydrogenase subunit beta [Desulfuromusa kysingii]